MKAYAYVVGPQDVAWTALFDFASDLGFAGVSSYRGLSQVTQQAGETPVCYFLFSAVNDIASLRSVADAIRFSPARQIRFSPMVYCAQDPSRDTIMSCINMGFDDIVALPQPSARLRSERLDRHIGKSVVFYETQGYFGPDRRDRLPQQAPRQGNRLGAPFRRLEIVRDLLAGVSVVRDEFCTPQNDGAALQTLQ